MTFTRVPVAQNAPLSGDFAHGRKQLVPLVFSHGESFDRMAYSAILSELASYGFLVIALNHNDGSCMFTVGEPQEADEDDPFAGAEPKIMGNEEGPIPIETKKNERGKKGKGGKKKKQEVQKEEMPVLRDDVKFNKNR